MYVCFQWLGGRYCWKKHVTAFILESGPQKLYDDFHATDPKFRKEKKENQWTVSLSGSSTYYINVMLAPQEP